MGPRAGLDGCGKSCIGYKIPTCFSARAPAAGNPEYKGIQVRTQ